MEKWNNLSQIFEEAPVFSLIYLLCVKHVNLQSALSLSLSLFVSVFAFGLILLLGFVNMYVT